MEHKFTNQLIKETSPYLLQHAHNPVNWYAWGEEALQKAKLEDKPILVSIGYSACHWCHVMERESFEDESTAEVMNQHYINIKIDREERPDLDHIYMDAVQAIAGNGGWPLNVFLTPEAKPFYGGTYFPPIRAYNRASWKEVLLNVHQLFTEKRHEVEAQAENLTVHLIDSNAFGATKAVANDKKELFTQENLQLIADNLLKQADTKDGGFGNAPKFPQTFSIQYLLRHYHFTKDERALKQALLSLDKMIYGGIYDQLGGGFARYSTDSEWLVPHFEKMLYDNALLVGVIAEAYQLTGNPLYEKTIRQTLGFIDRELTDKEGGFYSALDADSEGVEGKFYVWDKREIEDILGDESSLYCAYYDVSNHGNWDEGNILNVKMPLDEFAKRNNLDEIKFEELLSSCNSKLMDARDKRIRPGLDDKILLGWNALMVTAYCKAYAATGDESYKSTAERVISFIENKLGDNNDGYYHTYKAGVAKVDAFFDDYAYLIQSYIHLQEITSNQEYLKKAKQLTEYTMLNFKIEGDPFFYYTHKHQKNVIVRKKEVYDGAVPSGNAVMAFNLLYLSIVFGNNEWKQNSLNMIDSLGQVILKHANSFCNWSLSIQLLTNGMKEIVIAGQEFSKELTQMLKKYVPNKILQSTNVQMENYPLLAAKLVDRKTWFYLCEEYVCSNPVTSIDEFLECL